MPEPLVSVLIPLYNHEKYIETCLDSIASESYRNLELIVLDDGSRDTSLALAGAWIEAHRARFVRVELLSQANAGICRTANRLLAEAQGSYITFVASDDALQRDGIQARVAFLEQHPGTLAVFGDAEVMDEHGACLAASTIQDLHRGSRAALAHPGRIAKELILRWSIPGPVLLARRSTWDPVDGVGPYDETLSLEDRDFYLRLLARKGLAFLDRSVARYRVHSQNVSRTPSGGLDASPMQQAIARDIQRSVVLNLPRFRGWNRRLLALVSRCDRYRSPRKAVRYKLAQILLRLARTMNRLGLLAE